MRNSGTNKQQYQLDRSALKMSPQMSNSRHQISNLKVENVKNLQNIDCATLNQWKSHQRPITAPLQVSQYLTQQLQNHMKSNQNHLICTCPPEVHKALLEQQLLQHQTQQHQHLTAQHLQHFQPCPHQRHGMKSIVVNTGIDTQAMYAMINPQQTFTQPQIKPPISSAVVVDSNPSLPPQTSTNQSTLNYPSSNLQQTSWFLRQSNTPENMNEARAQITKMETQLMYLTSWIQNNWQVNVSNPTNGNYVANDSSHVPTVSDSIGLSQHSNCVPCYVVTSEQLSTDTRDGPSTVEATPSNSSLDSAYSAKSNTSSDNNSNIPKQQDVIPVNSQIFQTATIEQRLSENVIDKLQDSKLQLQCLKSDIDAFRKWNNSMKFFFKDEMNETFLKIKKLIQINPGVNLIPIRKEREKIDDIVTTYTSDVELQIDKLEDLEVAIEDLRMNVLNRRCRVNIEEVEVLALHLSKISKDLAKNKDDFPVLESNLRQIMQTEMEIMKNDERFLETQPRKVENALRLCKKLISTLFTLKRLGSVQENTGSDGIPEIRSNRDPKPRDKQAIFEGIKTISPDHEYRMQQIALSEKLRECRRRMLTSHETLKFEKSLELAAKTLKDIKSPPITKSIIDEQNCSSQTTISNNTTKSDSLSSLTDSDIDTNLKPETKVTKLEPTFVPGYINKAPIQPDLTRTSSSDTSNDQDSSDNCSSSQHRSPGNVKWMSSKISSKQSTILKTSQHSSRSNRSSKVAFNKTVTVEGGSEVLQLNCPEDDYDDDLSSMTFTSAPPPPPPRLSSQDETVSPPETELFDVNSSRNNIWHQKFEQVTNTEP